VLGVTSHTSHVTRHTSHVTRHTSHVTRHVHVPAIRRGHPLPPPPLVPATRMSHYAKVFAACCLVLAACCLLLAACCLPLAACFLLLAACYNCSHLQPPPPPPPSARDHDKTFNEKPMPSYAAYAAGETLNHKPQTPTHKRQTPNSKAQTPNPKPQPTSLKLHSLALVCVTRVAIYSHVT